MANVLFCGADSDMWMWKIPSGDSKVFQGQGENNECATILPDGKTLDNILWLINSPLASRLWFINLPLVLVNTEYL